MIQLHRFLHAYNTEAPLDQPSTGKIKYIFPEYKKKLEENQFDNTKMTQMISNLEETIERLSSNNFESNITKCTYWYNDNTLYFNPGLIDYKLVDQEQYNSLIIMHMSSLKRISVIIDCLSMTWLQAVKNATMVKFTNIVDGLRLWKTLPYRIDDVFVLSTSDYMLNQIIKMFLSTKIKKKTHVFKSWEDLNKVHSIYTSVTCDDFSGEQGNTE